MRLDHLWVVDFRNYASAEVALAPRGLTVVAGDNGAGKTNLLEAIGYLATLSSFRGVTNDALIRAGAGSAFSSGAAAVAIVRGEGERAGRALLIEAEIRPAGRGRVTVNRQPVRRTADLAGALRVSVFSPDDLELVKAGPTGRRRYLDDTLASLHPRNDAARRDLERVIRQRNALLAQAGGRWPLPGDLATTLEVWDARLAEIGEAVGEARADVVARLEPALAKSYGAIAVGDQMTSSAVGDQMTSSSGNGVAGLVYEAPWREKGLAAAIRAAWRDDVRRGVTSVGPHRDDLGLTIAGMPARTHASQGEQRSLALALRLAAHDVVTEIVGAPPLLLLDDVFSELDGARADALLEHLPVGQSVLTTAGPVPAGATPERVLRIAGGRVVAA